MSVQENLIICGPIVRRVDRSSVSIFVAVRRSCDVVLTVHANRDGATGAQIMKGKRKTIALGARDSGVHAAVVTARLNDALMWGESYHYDLTFVDDRGTWGLFDDGVLVTSQDRSARRDRLVYPGQERPGFVLPPADPASLRILHGSCRKPHGEGVDAMARADQLIADALADPDTIRPQQLFLTGDQIYADDVHSELLSALRAFAGREIRGHEEESDLKPYAKALEPHHRDELCSLARLSTESRANHLITLGEFYAMYLFAWSPEPWRGQGADSARAALAEFTEELPAVQRALANIATYMIFDDHEITDDWYIRENWCDRVLDSLLGRRIVRNGLTAYMVFQHWGNDPDQFEPGGPGERALAAVDGWDGTEKTAGVLNGALPVSACGADLAVPSSDRIDWWWRWRGPSYDVIGLDTRTRRRFDSGGVSLLTENDVDLMLGDGAPPRFTIVLSAVPVLGVSLMEWAQKKSNKLGWGLKADDEPWAHGTSFEHLVARLLDRAPVMVLSGDVHYGFGTSLFDRDHPRKRIVNFVSSALKNMPGKLARTGLWALGFTSDNALRSAVARNRDGIPLIVATKTVRTIADRTLQEEMLVDGDALIAGVLDEDRPELVLRDTRDTDRSDISARCNLGDIRVYPDRNEAVQELWYHHESWKRDRQVARFWLRGQPM